MKKFGEKLRKILPGIYFIGAVIINCLAYLYIPEFEQTWPYILIYLALAVICIPPINKADIKVKGIIVAVGVIATGIVIHSFTTMDPGTAISLFYAVSLLSVITVSIILALPLLIVIVIITIMSYLFAPEMGFWFWL